MAQVKKPVRHLFTLYPCGEDEAAAATATKYPYVSRGERGGSHRLTFPLVSPKTIFRPYPIGGFEKKNSFYPLPDTKKLRFFNIARKIGKILVT